ncbi:MAG: hypothetical protein VW080_09840 [Flavobacteriaceae bacterium]
MKIYSTLQRFYLSKYYLFVPASIIILACIGSMVAYYLTQDGMELTNFILLFLSVVGAMAYLTAVLGQLPRKKTFAFFFFGLLLEIGLLVISIAF